MKRYCSRGVEKHDSLEEEKLRKESEIGRPPLDLC
jgi:hypothetical protein